MKSLFRYLSLALIATIAYGCEVANDFGDATSPGDDLPPSVKPTVPIKRRPIVPTTKLPRPRIIERIEFDGSVLSVHFASESIDVQVELVNLATGESLVPYCTEGPMAIAVECGTYLLTVDAGDSTYTEEIVVEE